MSLISSNSHRDFVGNLRHGEFNLPAHCSCIETVLADSWLLNDRDRFVCGSLLRGMRRAKLGCRSGAQVATSSQQGSPASFLYCA